MKLPGDLREIKLKYSGSCRSCGRQLNVNERAHWSKSNKKVWCVKCVKARSRPSTHAAPGRVANRREKSAIGNVSQGAASKAPRSTRTRFEPSIRGAPPGNEDSAPPDSDESQTRWEQLCAYALSCIDAEAASSLVPYSRKDALWFFHGGEEQLVVGRSDRIDAPEQMREALEAQDITRPGRSIIYGWPMVVIRNDNSEYRVAPLFCVGIEADRQADNLWRLHAKTEPEVNLAITASGIFDRSVTEDIADLVSGGLPFGSADGMSEIAGKVCKLLGLSVLTPLDPRGLKPRADRRQGVYNAALSMVTEVSGYTSSLREELAKMQNRDDWRDTAAARLVPQGIGAATTGSTIQGPLAAPLPCNWSQEQTLVQLRERPLTVVTGPPGTGKTQLVVNAVTNAWLDGQKVLVTSTNNAAVDVAVDRAETDIAPGALIRTGNREARERLPSVIAAAGAWASSHGDAQTASQRFASRLVAKARAELQRAVGARSQLKANLKRLDRLDEKLLEVMEEREEVNLRWIDTEQALWPEGKPPQLPMNSREIERRARRLRNAWFFRRWRLRRLRKRLGLPNGASLTQLISWTELEARRMTLTDRLNALGAERDELTASVGDPAESIQKLDARWEQASREAIQAEIAARFRSGASRLGAFNRAAAGGGALKQVISNSMDSLRGWACTSLSTSPNFPLEHGLFDLVIVDEASQCSLAAVLPLAYRAKRLAVVGDPCQLNPIVSVNDGHLKRIASDIGFDNDDLRRRGMHHKDGSAYLSFEFALRSGEPVLLDEHYRCHPHIARWFNRTFYNEQLTVLTDIVQAARGVRAIAWMDVEGTAERPRNGRSWLNRIEAKQTVQQLGQVLELGLTVGVVTPFAAQAQLIKQLANTRFGRVTLDEAGFVCGTAHSLQGNERDAVVISTVLAPGMLRTGARWLERERNLLNVAVSRARMALIVVGHPAVGQEGSPTLASLRTYLRDEVGRLVNADGGETAEFRIDSEAEKRLITAMQLSKLEPLAKLNVEGYELDFALMEQGIKLNIEVDGDQHLDARGRQRRQDITRDRILSRLGWTVIRIPAWRCYAEIDSVLDEINHARSKGPELRGAS